MGVLSLREIRGFTLIELLVVVAILSLFATVGIANVLSVRHNSKCARAAADTKTAVTQAIMYANDRAAYPTSLQTLRTSGYVALDDIDPWNRPYVLAELLTSRARPNQADDVYIYSKGANGTGAYQPGGRDIGAGGAVGYSSIYGSFRGVFAEGGGGITSLGGSGNPQEGQGGQESRGHHDHEGQGGGGGQGSSQSGGP